MKVPGSTRNKVKTPFYRLQKRKDGSKRTIEEYLVEDGIKLGMVRVEEDRVIWKEKNYI